MPGAVLAQRHDVIDVLGRNDQALALTVTVSGRFAWSIAAQWVILQK